MHTTIREVILNYKSTTTDQFKVTGPDNVAEFIRSILPDNSREHFISLYLDGAHQVIGYSVIGTGTANACTVHPREIFQRAIMLGSVSIVISHNHPSGSLAASNEDKKITKQLKECAKVLGINLLDHIIVTDSNHFSFKESDLMDQI